MVQYHKNKEFLLFQTLKATNPSDWLSKVTNTHSVYVAFSRHIIVEKTNISQPESAVKTTSEEERLKADYSSAFYFRLWRNKSEMRRGSVHSRMPAFEKRLQMLACVHLHFYVSVCVCMLVFLCVCFGCFSASVC